VGALNAVTLNALTLLVRLGADVNDYAALGIFFRFQVTDFDLCFGFFSLCHFIFSILFVWVVCRCVVFSDAEGHLTPALNVLFGNQVVEMNQFISWALAPFISWFCGGRVLFFLRCIHLGSLMLSASVPSVRGHSEKQRVAATFSL